MAGDLPGRTFHLIAAGKPRRPGRRDRPRRARPSCCTRLRGAVRRAAGTRLRVVPGLGPPALPGRGPRSCGGVGGTGRTTASIGRAGRLFRPQRFPGSCRPRHRADPQFRQTSPRRPGRTAPPPSSARGRCRSGPGGRREIHRSGTPGKFWAVSPATGRNPVAGLFRDRPCNRPHWSAVLTSIRWPVRARRLVNLCRSRRRRRRPSHLVGRGPVMPPATGGPARRPRILPRPAAETRSKSGSVFLLNLRGVVDFPAKPLLIALWRDHTVTSLLPIDPKRIDTDRAGVGF
jgi:hypothetical protein